jgi:rifampicin phosphotransferase
LSELEGGRAFLDALEAFLEANGARAAGEFELAVPRWREAPGLVVELLMKYVQAQETGGLPGDAAGGRHRQAAIARITTTNRPLRRCVLRRLLASYAFYTTARENVKYRLMQGYALLRGLFLDLGSDLVSRGILDDAGDIFYLTPAQALAAAQRDDVLHSSREVVQLGKEQHEQWASQPAPGLVVEGGRAFVDAPGDGLAGIGCSPGIVEGVARVLSDISEADALRPGEILVAPHTDPGWTPLFLICGAVVTEVGGFLSHGATVAREYGIPAVVNVKGATTRIHTGDIIRVDGAAGRITVCDGCPTPTKQRGGT